MDSPDRMSWTPSSSAKKRKYDEFIDTCVHIRIPGAYPSSPEGATHYLRGSQYQISPTPASRFIRPGLSAEPQFHHAMFDNETLPPSLRRLYQMVANVGSAVHAISSSAVGTLAGPGGRAARYIENNFGPLYAAVEAIGNGAKRIKLTLSRQSLDQPSASPSAPLPSTPPRRISRCVNRTPTPAFRTQSSILRQTRDTSFRKVKKTLRWVEDQQFINEASHDMIRYQNNHLSSAYGNQANEQSMPNVEYSHEPVPNQYAVSDGIDDSELYISPIQDHPQAHNQTSFEPVMSGALPYGAEEVSDLTTISVDDRETFSDDSFPSELMLNGDEPSHIASTPSSEYSDSVTSSFLEGLDEEDLRGVETREEKKARKKQEAKETFATIKATHRTSRTFSKQLQAINHIEPSPRPPKKSVAFYNSPRTGFPVTLVKEYSSEDALTPPIKPYNGVPISKVPTTPSGNAKTSLRRLKSVAVSPPVTPENIASNLSSLGVSNRRSSTRLDLIAAEEQVKRDQAAALEAEEAEKKAKEEAAQRAADEARQAEERIRLGTRRMPTGAVIQPLTAAWEDEVARAMQTGLSSQRELARTSAGESIRRRDFGHVLPQSGVDSPAGWLNDTIISAYLQAVVDYGQKMRDVRRGALPKVHAFNTFFYKNLSDKGYDGVRRWATRAKFGGKDLLNMEKIFIPINKGGNHWVLAHINPQSKTIEYFDSFHGSSGSVFDNIKVWLRGELRDAFVDSEWTLSQGRGPIQRNGSDCGVFCTTTAKMIVLGVDPMAFSADDIPTQRRRMLAELMNGGFDGDFVPNIKF
ncbi:MAG: hypothetical protein LQ343_007201 [Gyalolechia ehrenbergii]|nr:MAG: hypothetical protein LQ343_007201 [Gyalolechia ehrenbergii]